MGRFGQVTLLLFLMFLGAVVVAGIFGGGGGSGEGAGTAAPPAHTTLPPETSPEPTPPPTTRAPTAPPSTAPPTTSPPTTQPPQMVWKRVLRWDGLAGKDVATEAFLITSDSWRVRWGMQGSEFAILSIAVYRIVPPLVYPYELYMIDNPGEDTIYFHEPGMYYLDISSANCQWHVEVEEELPEDEEPFGSVFKNASWELIKSWSGSNDKTTEKFETPRIWRVKWRVTPENQYSIFSITVYDSRGDLVYSMDADTGSGVFYVYDDAEEVYLKILCANVREWSVRVEMQRPGG